MRRFLPQTLPAWVLLILIAGLLLTQVATLSVVSRDRRMSGEILELYRLNDRVLSLVKAMHASTPQARQALAASLSNPTLVVAVSGEPIVENAIPANQTLAEMEDIMVDRLNRYAIVDARIRRESPDQATTRRVSPVAEEEGKVERGLTMLNKGFAQTDRLIAAIQFQDGQWLNVSMPTTPVGSVLNLQNLPLFLAIAALVVAMSIWSLRRLTAPYRTLENAVRTIGTDLKSPPLPESGSREYRMAAHAINAMQARLQDYVEDRDRLAAALAHDLRTPLTRMRLRLELLGEGAVHDAFARDLGEIDAIARSVIDFATMEYSQEASERVDFWSFAVSIVDGYPDVTFDRSDDEAESLICEVRPTALRRCVANLLDNAVAYGGRARVSLAAIDDTVTLRIVDEGPGIPADKLQSVMRPFVRLESSRNRRTGGLGLGLTIASTFAAEMGGRLTLSNAEEGGLCAELTLPRTR